MTGGYGIGDLHREFSGRWRFIWRDYLDGRYLTATSLTEPVAHFARRTAEEMRDALRGHETAQAGRAQP